MALPSERAVPSLLTVLRQPCFSMPCLTIPDRDMTRLEPNLEPAVRTPSIASHRGWNRRFEPPNAKRRFACGSNRQFERPNDIPLLRARDKTSSREQPGSISSGGVYFIRLRRTLAPRGQDPSISLFSELDKTDSRSPSYFLCEPNKTNSGSPGTGLFCGHRREVFCDQRREIRSLT